MERDEKIAWANEKLNWCSFNGATYYVAEETDGAYWVDDDDLVALWDAENNPANDADGYSMWCTAHGTLAEKITAALKIYALADSGGIIQAVDAVDLHSAAHPERHTTQSMTQAAEWLGCADELDHVMGA